MEREQLMKILRSGLKFAQRYERNTISFDVDVVRNLLLELEAAEEAEQEREQERTVHECKCGDTNKEVLEKIERQDAALAEFIGMCMTFMSLQMTYNMQCVSVMGDKGEIEELPEMSQVMVAAGLESMESFVNNLVGTMENVIKKRLKVKDVDIEELMRMFKSSTERTDN